MTSVAMDVPVVPDLAPVSLAELVAQAELLTRIDRKYVVTVTEARELMRDLPDDARVLDIEGRRSFRYRSTYLDSPDRASYLLSGRSRRHRWKVRTRCYLDSDTSWLEVKTRAARGQTVKRRMAHADADMAQLTVAGRRFVSDVIGADSTEALRPALVTSYRRSTLLLPRSCSRVTIDVELGWTSLSSGQDLTRPLLAIVETKTGSTPSDVDRLLWSHGHRPVRLSKYGTGLAALHPELPRLKWHRAMERHLDIPRTPTHPQERAS